MIAEIFGSIKHYLENHDEESLKYLQMYVDPVGDAFDDSELEYFVDQLELWEKHGWDAVVAHAPQEIIPVMQ